MEDIDARSEEATRKINGLNYIIKDRKLPPSLRRRLITQIVCATALYNGCSWYMDNKGWQRIIRLESKCNGIISGFPLSLDRKSQVNESGLNSIGMIHSLLKQRDGTGLDTVRGLMPAGIYIKLFGRPKTVKAPSGNS
jgi:hypothetical protein